MAEELEGHPGREHWLRGHAEVETESIAGGWPGRRRSSRAVYRDNHPQPMQEQGSGRYSAIGWAGSV